MDPKTIAVLAIAVYLISRSRKAGATEQKKIPASALPGKAATMQKAPPGTYVLRANQPAALAWVPVFERAGASPAIAQGLARWAGIESSGNPRAKSKLNEVGLLQVSPATAKEIFTNDEYLRLSSPLTNNEEHARLALKQFSHHLKRVGTYAKVPDDPESQLFYAKLHHQRPVMVKEAWAKAKALSSTGWPQARLAARLAGPTLTADFQRNYLKAASVVGWGSESPDGAAVT